MNKLDVLALRREAAKIEKEHGDESETRRALRLIQAVADTRQTNRDFAAVNQEFHRACERVVTRKWYNPKTDEMEVLTLPPTRRQASKFRRGKGAAFTGNLGR